MSRAFNYKPKFVDIRVRPPKKGEEAEATADVYQLKPGERRCDAPDCLRPASCRAPKSRDLPNDVYWFCQEHAAEYNRHWNFFAGMSDEQAQAHREASMTGDRPTWSFKASNASREAAAFAARSGKGAADPFGMFAAAKKRAQADAAAAARKMGKLERRALAEMDLDETADGKAIRGRYIDLVKRFHPDSNGGDRSSEQKLQRVLRAYNTLKAAKLI